MELLEGQTANDGGEPRREQHTARDADGHERLCLQHQLPCDLGRARAERHPHRQLPPAIDGSHEQQARKIGKRDEEREPGRPREKAERSRGAAGYRFREWRRDYVRGRRGSPTDLVQHGFQVVRSGIPSETGHDPDAETCPGLRVRRISRR